MGIALISMAELTAMWAIMCIVEPKKPILWGYGQRCYKTIRSYTWRLDISFNLRDVSLLTNDMQKLSLPLPSPMDLNNRNMKIQIFLFWHLQHTLSDIITPHSYTSSEEKKTSQKSVIKGGKICGFAPLWAVFASLIYSGSYFCQAQIKA